MPRQTMAQGIDRIHRERAWHSCHPEVLPASHTSSNIPFDTVGLESNELFKGGQEDDRANS